MKDEEQKEEQQVSKQDNTNLEAENNQEEKILRPTISSEELLSNRENNNQSKILTAKVEQYNFNQGFKSTKQVNESLGEIKEKNLPITFQINSEKIDIKPPRKRNKYLPIILILVLVLLGAGTYFYLNFYNKPSEVTPPPQKEEEKVKEKQNKTTCRLAIKQEEQKKNTIIEYIYYDKEEKLQAYEQKVTYEYLEEVPKNILDECSLNNESYKGYEGYSNTCIKNDELSYTFKTAVDLNKLEEKTLTFDNNTITITASLNDDTSSFKKTYEDSNYECEKEEVVIEDEIEETEIPNEVIDE